MSLSVSDAWAQGRPPSQRPAAAQAAPVPAKVAVEVSVVHASNKYDRVDPSLRSVMQHLRFLKYRGFKLLGKESQPLADGDRHTFKIVGNRQVKVELLGHTASAAKLRVQMFNPQNKKTLDTTVSIHRKKSFMVAGPKHEDGVLVLPLSANY